MKRLDDCHVDPIQKAVDEQALATASVLALAVEGMGCTNCASRVRNALVQLDGVWTCDVDLRRGVALVRYDPAAVHVPDLLHAVAAAGRASSHYYRARLLFSR